MGAGFKGTRRNGKPKQFSPQNRGEYEQALKWTDRMAKRRQDREQRRKLQEQTPVQRGEPTP